VPLYDYQCEDCGAFSAWRSMREAGQSVACPRCQQGARRVISAPNVAVLSKPTRMAWERNERSAHAPQMVRREH
jgi:putative FmdB family regulatory protein